MPEAATILRTFFDEEGSLPTNRVQSYTKTEGHLFTPLIFNVIWE